MNSLRVLVVLIASFMVFSLVLGEEIVLTTFYPSPAGVYKSLSAESLEVDNLTLKPQGRVPSDPSEGMIFYSTGEARDSEGNTLTRGIWIHAADKWFPLAIFRRVN